MCLLIITETTPTGEESIISEELLRDAYLGNHDGWGYSVKLGSDPELYLKKGFNIEELVDDVKKIQAGYPRSKLCVHLRLRTSGEISTLNCHPFSLGTSGIVMYHNGVFPHSKESGEQSDTAWLASEITPWIEGAKSKIIGSDLFKAFLEQWIGDSRVAFHDASTGQVYIYKKATGYYFESNWVSNHYAFSLWRKSEPYYKNTYTPYKHAANAFTNPPALPPGKPEKDLKIPLTTNIGSKLSLDERIALIEKEWEESVRANTTVVTSTDIKDPDPDPDPDYSDIDFDELVQMEYENLLDVCIKNPDAVATTLYMAGQVLLND